MFYRERAGLSPIFCLFCHLLLWSSISSVAIAAESLWPLVTLGVPVVCISPSTQLSSFGPDGSLSGNITQIAASH